MRFDSNTRSLFTDDGKLLKKLNCPLNKNWNALVIDSDTPLKRHCNSCNRSVIDITSFTEEQVENLLSFDADSCLCIRMEPSQIEWIEESSYQRGGKFGICTVDENERHDGSRIVKTARTAGQINSNRDEYIVIEKAVDVDVNMKTKVVIKYDRVGYSGFDFRANPKGVTNWWYPIKSTSPFAAYLVPQKTEVGERVFVPDIIENFVASRWNQGDVYRLEKGFGIFTGEDIEFNYPTDLEEVGEILG